MPMAIESSKDTFLRNSAFNVVGPPGVGKTWMAATFSEHFPSQPGPAELKDGLWILADPGGLDGLTEAGITVPTLDLSSVPSAKLLGSMKEVRTLVAKQVQAGVTKFVVQDTVTSLDKMLLAALQETYDKWGLYAAVLKEHMQFYQALRTLGVPLINIFHLKMTGGDDAAQKAKLDAQGLAPGQATLDITGSSLNAYRGGASLTLPVRKQKNPDGTWKRVCLPHSDAMDAKSRFACLDKQEPADFRHILAKVKAAAAK